MSKPLLIYVAGPYTAERRADRRNNTERAMDAGLALVAKGHYPVVPHLTHYLDERCFDLTGGYLVYGFYIALDDRLLAACDALFYLAPSPGADRELARAKRRGLPIYRTLDEVPDADL